MSTLFAPPPSHPHVIRFRRPEALPDDLDLDEVFRQYKLPDLKGRSDETIGEYHTHLRRWRECWDDHRARCATSGEGWKYRMIYPVLPEIGRLELLAFRDWLQIIPEDLGNRTINKHVSTVQAVLRAAEASELIGRAPKIDPLPVGRGTAKHWLTPLQVDQLMDAAGNADWPRGLPLAPSVYWRAAIVGFCTYGFRTQELVAYEGKMTGLQWSDLHWEAETPHPAGQASCEWGWLVYTPEKQRRLKGEPLVLPLTETMHRWLQSIRPEGRAEGPVFPWPLCNQSFYDTWEAIIRAAGVKPKRSLDGVQGAYQLKHLRKTATTWINDHRPGMSDWIVGHGDDRSPDALVSSRSPSKVGRLHYDNAENRIVECLLSLPVPSSFTRLRPDPQLRLF